MNYKNALNLLYEYIEVSKSFTNKDEDLKKI